MTLFNKVKNTKVYETVINELREKIVSGQLGPGDYLPTERELAEMMGVSRASVREALKVLEFMGLIESKPKGGTNISSVSPEILIDKLNALDLSSSDCPLLDLIELREALEPTIVRLAVERATEEEIAELKNNLKGLEDNHDEEYNTRADALFHLNIAKASHNIFFIQLMEVLLAMLKEIRAKTLSMSRERKKIIEEHQVIVKSMEERDKAAAVAAIETHIKNIKAIVQKKF